jgi:hypothetical protein
MLKLEGSFLHAAWGYLEAKHLRKKVSEASEAGKTTDVDTVAVIENCLRQHPQPLTNSLLSIEDVVCFLRVKDGRRFIGDDEEGYSLRPA